MLFCELFAYPFRLAEKNLARVRARQSPGNKPANRPRPQDPMFPFQIQAPYFVDLFKIIDDNCSSR